MKKVLFVCSVASMIDQFNMANIELLQSMHCEVHVAANFEKGNTVNIDRLIKLKKTLFNMGVFIHHIEINRNPFKFVNLIKLFQLRSLIKKEELSLIHCQSPIGGALARIGVIGFKHTGVKVLYTAHGFHFFNGAPFLKRTVFYSIEKILARFTDTIITINNEDYETALKKFRNTKIDFINGIGIDVGKFKPHSNAQKEELRKLYKYKPENYILVYVAELCKRKNQMMLINSVDLLRKYIPEIKLILVGIGFKEAELKKHVEKLDMISIVDFIGYSENVADYLNMADVGTSTSLQEGLPVNVMEYMSTGLPVIVTECRGNIDLVQNGINGYVVPIGSIEGFSDKVLDLYNNTDIAEQFSKQNLNIIDNYSKEVINYKMAEIYKRILS